jgi:hypothetical protein
MAEEANPDERIVTAGVLIIGNEILVARRMKTSTLPRV